MIEVGDLVQINPEYDSRFGGCIMIVTEIKSWGVQGCVIGPAAEKAAHYYYRCPTEHFVKVGKAEWALE